MLFRELTSQEESEFRAWARDNKEECFAASNETLAIWHPVIRDEIEKMKSE
jgi:hypothetical protein